MIVIDVRFFLEHEQAIRSTIGPESIEKWRDVQNEPIWANLWKKAKGILLGLFFIDTDCSIFKIHYKCSKLIWLKGI
jgi:hypothetical protein